MLYLDYTVFCRLLAEVTDYDNAEMYIAERGWQEWMDAFSADNVVDILNAIYDMRSLTLEKVRKLAGIETRISMSREYMIPIRTLEAWDSGSREAPEYVRSLLLYTFFMRMINKEETNAES